MSSPRSDLPQRVKRALELEGFQGALRENVSLAPYTHVRLGGSAALVAEPFLAEEVARVVRACRELDAPLWVLGGGSNVLVPDQGLAGLVLMLPRLNRVVRDGDRITAGAGVTLPSLVRATKDVGLAGLETLVGIPAVVGGAVAMNAGTREGQTFDHLVQLTMVDDDGEVRVVPRAQLAPQYRSGELGRRIVLDATWELRPDAAEAIQQRLELSLKRRNATQPVAEKSLGCVFQNPAGDSAGRLIEEAGCKLLRRGNVSVSGKHANYFVNEGGGSAADFVQLLREVQARVRERFAVELQPEVKLW